MRSTLAVFERRRKMATGIALAICLVPFLIVQGRDFLEPDARQGFIDLAEWLRPLSLSQFLDEAVRQRLLSQGGPIPKFMAIAYLDLMGAIATLGLLISLPLLVVGIGVNWGRVGMIMLFVWLSLIGVGLLAAKLFVESTLRLNTIGGEAILAGLCLGLLYVLASAIGTAWLPVSPARDRGIGSGGSEIAGHWDSAADGGGDGGGGDGG